MAREDGMLANMTIRELDGEMQMAMQECITLEKSSLDIRVLHGMTVMYEMIQRLQGAVEGPEEIESRIVIDDTP